MKLVSLLNVAIAMWGSKNVTCRELGNPGYIT